LTVNKKTLILAITDSANADQQVLTPPSSSKIMDGILLLARLPLYRAIFLPEICVLVTTGLVCK
jgi:hypothetical protein